MPPLPGHGSCWTLSLDLLTTANRRRGSIAIHRLYGMRHLQLDINLIVTEFPVALADALDRVLSEEPEMLVTPGRDAGAIAAQAG
jgi:hypothetical protein